MPSFEVPSLYFRYQRYRRFRPLLPVFEHNRLDVLSLVTLLVHLTRLLGGDGVDEIPRITICPVAVRICNRDGDISAKPVNRAPTSRP